MKAYPFFSVAVFTAVISTFSCSSDDGGNDNAGGGGNSSGSGGGYTGSYGSVMDGAGRTYRTVKIGT